MRAVAWNQPLSGNLFRSSQSVKLRPLVAEMQLGMSARLGRATVAFVAHRTGAEYTTRNAAHAWSTLEAEWRFGP
jgi:hypothetical protein